MQATMCFIDFPQAGQHPSILVGVGIAEHHLLPSIPGLEQRQIVRQNWFSFLEFLPRPVQFAVLAAGAIVGLARFWLLFSIVLKP